MSAGVRIAVADEEIRRCFPLYRELRPHLTAEAIVERVRRQEAAHGYVLVYVEEGGGPVALAGFREGAEFRAGPGVVRRRPLGDGRGGADAATAGC